MNDVSNRAVREFSEFLNIIEDVNIVGTKDNGVRANPSLYVLRRTNMPAVLVELAYLTNAGDAEKLETMQSEFARGIYEGTLSYFGMDQ